MHPTSRLPSRVTSIMAAETFSSSGAGSLPAALPVEATASRIAGVTPRVVTLSLALAFFFGYVIPIIDMKMRNTFLGATHLPVGAIAVLLVVLLVINPLLHQITVAPAKRTAIAGVGAGLFLLAGVLYVRGLSTNNLAFEFWILVAGAAITALVLLLGRAALSRNETLVVYISCLFTCLTPGHGAENVFVVNLIGPFYYATHENKWLDFLVPYFKPWMTPALHVDPKYGDQAKDITGQWFLGSPSGAVPWGAWLVPLFVWGFFIFVLYTMMACLCVMLRKQWAEREALSFPLLKLPMELTEDVDHPQKGGLGDFFRNRVMWLGFGIPVFIHLLRGLNGYYPDVPFFPLELVTGPLLTEAPWNQIGTILVNIFPIVVGISFLLTTEVSFSFWFFYWFVKVQLILAYYLGFMPSTLPPAIGTAGMPARTFTFYQTIGCYIAYVALVLFSAREHLRHILLRSLGRRAPEADEGEEALSYPVAFWGFVVTFVLLVVWSIAAGLNPGLALLLWTIYLFIIIAMTRIISEAGILFVQQGWAPLGTIGQITGAGPGHALLSATSLPPAALLQSSLMFDLRGFIMPSFMQGFKLAHDRKIALNPLLRLIMVCTLISLIMGVYMNLTLGYKQGGLTLDSWVSGPASQLPATTAAGLVKGVRDASWFNLVWIALGILLTYGMMVARARYPWFPLHPLGFLLSQSYPLTTLWFSIFLGWLAKVMIMRFGGTETYRKVTPFFLGVVLGDVAMMLFWLVIDGWQGRVGHKLMPV